MLIVALVAVAAAIVGGAVAIFTPPPDTTAAKDAAIEVEEQPEEPPDAPWSAPAPVDAPPLENRDDDGATATGGAASTSEAIAPATELDAPQVDGTIAVEPARDPVLPPGPPSDERTLERTTTIRGPISPKSVVASPTGLVIAQNLMYRHTITVYDRERELVATIPDTVNPAELGLPGPDADLRGSPVEAAFSPDGRYAYVSNYKMYGPGFTGVAPTGVRLRTATTTASSTASTWSGWRSTR